MLCLTWLLELVGNDAAHEVRVRAVQCGHQLVQLFLVAKAEERAVLASLQARGSNGGSFKVCSKYFFFAYVRTNLKLETCEPSIGLSN